MAFRHFSGYCARITLPLLLTVGCSIGGSTVRQACPVAAAPAIAQHQATSTSGSAQPLRRLPVQQASHRVETTEQTFETHSDGLFADEQELLLEELTDLVLARNASLQAMTFAWRSATERYPQAVALDDPVFQGMIAPGSVNAADVETGYQVGAAQKLPWFGKRSVRGSVAQADAAAMFHDLRDARLQLSQTTRAAYFEYYLIARQLEINRNNLELTRDFRETAQKKYENNQVTQQDVLQADVEYASTERRLLELDRMMRIAVARINTLLQRTPEQRLPAPPNSLSDSLSLPPVNLLRQLAVSQRPDLAALRARVASEQAAVALAEKQFYPDMELYGRYDTFWQPASTQGPLRGQVGVNVNMPIYRQKLNAGVNEAQFRLSQRQAEYSQKLVDVQYDVESAYAQVEEAQKAISLYREKLLPAAEQTVETTRANYDVGTTTFLNVLMAQQQLLIQREQYQQVLAAAESRRADLERAIGGDLPQSGNPEELPMPLP